MVERDKGRMAAPRGVQHREWISDWSSRRSVPEGVWSTSASRPFFRNENAREETSPPILSHRLFMPLRFSWLSQPFFPRVISMHNDFARPVEENPRGCRIYGESFGNGGVASPWLMESYGKQMSACFFLCGRCENRFVFALSVLEEKVIAWFATPPLSAEIAVLCVINGTSGSRMTRLKGPVLRPTDSFFIWLSLILYDHISYSKWHSQCSMAQFNPRTTLWVIWNWNLNNSKLI